MVFGVVTIDNARPLAKFGRARCLVPGVCQTDAQDATGVVAGRL